LSGNQIYNQKFEIFGKTLAETVWTRRVFTVFLFLKKWFDL